MFFQWLWYWSIVELCVDSAAEERSNDPVVYVYRASHYFQQEIAEYRRVNLDTWTNTLFDN